MVPSLVSLPNEIILGPLLAFLPSQCDGLDSAKKHQKHGPECRTVRSLSQTCVRIRLLLIHHLFRNASFRNRDYTFDFLRSSARFINAFQCRPDVVSCFDRLSIINVGRFGDREVEAAAGVVRLLAATVREVELELNVVGDMEALFESMRACVAAKSVVLQIHGVMTKQVAGLALVVLSEMGAGKLKKIKLRIRKPRDEHSWGMFVNALRTHAPTLEDVDIALRRCGENTSEFEDALDVLLKAASGKLRNLRWDVEDERPHYTLSSVQRSINDNAVHPWILQSLGLTHTFLYSTEDAQVLAEALLEMTRTLQHLSLLSSQITDEAMAILAPAISALDDLQTLDLGRNLISDAGCASLVSAWVFSCPSRLKLTHLQLGHNCIGEIGFKVLASKLPVVAPCLHTLNLSWNRSRNTALPIQASSLVGLLCPSALTDLVPPLDTVWSDLLTPPNLPRLQTLKIVNTEFLTQRGLADLAQALHLRSTNMPLRELDLSFSFRRVRPGPNTEGSTGLLCLFLQLLARSPTTCCELNYLGIGCNRNRDANPGNSPPSSPSPEHLREWRALVRVLPMLKSTHGLGLSGWSVSNWRVRVAESVEEGVCIPERVVEILDDLSCGDDDGVCIVS